MQSCINTLGVKLIAPQSVHTEWGAHWLSVGPLFSLMQKVLWAFGFVWLLSDWDALWWLLFPPLLIIGLICYVEHCMAGCPCRSPSARQRSTCWWFVSWWNTYTPSPTAWSPSSCHPRPPPTRTPTPAHWKSSRGQLLHTYCCHTVWRCLSV